MNEAMYEDPTGRLTCICEHGNAARVDHQQDCPYWTKATKPLRVASPLDDRLTTIQKESETLWQQLGQKEYVKRVVEAEMAQLCQRILLLNQESDTLKKASASSG